MPKVTFPTWSVASTGILTTALISERPDIMGINQPPPDVQAHIAAGRRLHGLRPITVRCATGAFALMFCEPGSNLSRPEKVIAGFNPCFWVKHGRPYGGSE